MVNETLPVWDPHSEDHLLNINVGGLKRSLCSSTLKKFPDTRLGRLLSCDSEESILQICDDYDVTEKEFYFDRNPGLFPYVLDSPRKQLVYLSCFHKPRQQKSSPSSSVNAAAGMGSVHSNLQERG
ncbi:UNVERIFIED_CONTAM: hypothetical protein FKN15_075196 [Acipenser sinensis]